MEEAYYLLAAVTVDEGGSAAVEGTVAEARFVAEFETVAEAAVKQESVSGTATEVGLETESEAGLVLLSR